MILLLTGCLADLKPPELVEGPQPEREANGRALLAAAADAHGGLATWKAKQSTELIFADHWIGIGTWFNPWPDASMRGSIRQRPGTFDSRVTFLGGEQDGVTWGIDDGVGFVVSAAGERSASDDSDLLFMLPTTQYFVDLPFRIQEAALVRAAEPQTLDGTPYDVVYATWGSIEKNAEFDQYLLYLDPQTHRIAKAYYTVRAISGFVTGTAHFTDLREVDGLWIPHTMVVTQSPTDAPDAALHTMTIERLRYDGLDRGTLALRDGVEPLVP